MTSSLFGKPLFAAGLAAAVLCLLGPIPRPAAAEVYAYPLNKQSAEQQGKDELDCLQWASERTGFDPRRPPQYQGGGYSAPPPSQPSGVFGTGRYGGASDAGRGAALGAVGGAIAGNAGAGAAIGALSGVFIGGVKRSSASAEQQAWSQQQAQQESQRRAQYDNQIAQLQGEHDRAFAACMSGRGYRVN